METEQLMTFSNHSPDLDLEPPTDDTSSSEPERGDDESVRGRHALDSGREETTREQGRDRATESGRVRGSRRRGTGRGRGIGRGRGRGRGGSDFLNQQDSVTQVNASSVQAQIQLI